MAVRECHVPQSVRWEALAGCRMVVVPIVTVGSHGVPSTSRRSREASRWQAMSAPTPSAAWLVAPPNSTSSGWPCGKLPMALARQS